MQLPAALIRASWTASTLLPSKETGLVSDGHPLYNPNISSTFSPMDGYNYSIGYMDGSGSLGIVGHENVTIGGASVAMPIGVATNLSLGSPVAKPRNTHGPVGLSFSAGNSIRPDPQPTFLDAIAPHLVHPWFSTFFHQDNTSFIEFGAPVNHSLYSGSLTHLKIANTSDESSGAWSAHGVSYSLAGSNETDSTPPTRLEFDTGGPTMTVPQSVFDAFWARAHGGDKDAGTLPCDADAALPDFVLRFTDETLLQGPSKVTVPGRYVIDRREPKDGMCGTFLGVSSEDGGAGAGIPFFTSMYVVWQTQRPAIVFGRQAELGGA